MRLIAIVLSVAIGGCATAGTPSSVTSMSAAPEEPVVDVRQECHAAAASAVGRHVLRSALTTAGLASFYLILRGAGEDAWIGTSVGAGRRFSAWWSASGEL